MRRKLRLAMVQAAPIPGNAAVDVLGAQIDEIQAVHGDVDLVVFPEVHLYGDGFKADNPAEWFASQAQPVQGPLVVVLSELARAKQVWLVPGTIPELADDGRVFNTALAFAPDGTLVSSYRKVFPWRPFEHWAPGDHFVVFDIPDIARIGFTICYDAWFPEATRSVAWMGAEIVLNIVQTTTPDRRQERVLAQANAISNQVFMVSVNAGGLPGVGGSIIVDPNGDVIAESPGHEPETTVIDLDLDRLEEVRKVGTEGLNRLWGQLRADDPTISLPAYDGQLNPTSWNPNDRLSEGIQP